MRKKLIPYLALSASFLMLAGKESLFAQDLIGYNYNNYLGVNSVTSNPAAIASSRYKFHFNLFTVNAYCGTNAYEISKGGSFFNFDRWKERRNIKNEKKNGWMNADILGPSFLLNLSKKHAIGLSTRVRTMTNMYNLSNGAISLFENPTTDLFGKTFNEKNVKANVHAFADLGLTYARVFKNEGRHFLKGGATVKYIQGISAASVRMENLDVNIKDLNTLNQVNGKASIMYDQKLDRWMDDEDDFDFNEIMKQSSTIGLDLGAVYEIRDGKFKPNENKFKSQYRTIPYSFRFSFAVTDLAFSPLKYKTGKESANYSLSAANIKIDTFDVENADDPEEYLKALAVDNLLTKETNTGDLKMFLPTSLRGNIDWHVARQFFVNADALISLRGAGTKKSGTNYISTISLTPRFESQWFGLSSPISFNKEEFNWGASVRLGPIFIGSGSILSSMVKKEFSNLDAYAGLSIPLYQGERRKKQKKETPAPQPEPVVEAPKPVVVADKDKDGVPDEKDACPEIAGLAQYNGCPDTDGDAIIDIKDKCPTQAGLAKYNGCPIPDTDGDGINDEEDKCPTQAGIKANNGCPEIKEEVKKTVERTAKHLFFVFGKATITTNSYPALNELAAIMQEDNTLLLDIEGHTDNIGSDASNLKLSELRADAAKQYLIKKGINAERITAVGLGETQPVAPNTTSEGRAQNRRIVLKIRNN